MNLRTRLLRFVEDPRLFLLVVALTYAVIYMGHPAAPGNNPEYPGGWWGWFDQGQYLTAAHAFAVFDFVPAHHFYPPLYPLLGALFLPVSAVHPFWLIDLVCLLWFAWCFIHFARRYVAQWLAVLIFLLAVVANRALFENFVIPWTSTLSATLLSVGIYSLSRCATGASRGGVVPARLGTGALAACSLALGLIAALRPADALVGGLLWLGVMGAEGISCRIAGRPFMRRLALATSALAVGPLLFLSFNLLVFGSPFGGYIHANSANGYFPADAAEKFVSLFLDGYTLYLELKAGLIDHYPWLALALPALVFVLIRGDWALRVVAAAVCLQFALYLPYGDLLPNGLWRYLNIHYFKWTFPYLALFACYAGLTILRSMRANPIHGLAWSAFLVVAALLLASLRTEVDHQPLPVRFISNPISNAEFVLQTGDGDIDLLDLSGLRGGFTDIYFGEHRLTLDGRELARVRDYRVLPAPWGVRILFIRPVRGRLIAFRPDRRLTVAQEELSASSGNYHFVLGQPKPFWDEATAIPAAVYPLGTMINFSSSGKGEAYTRGGWSTPEPWGRWSIGKQASLRFKLQPAVAEVKVELLVDAFVNGRHFEQSVDVKVNGSLVKRLVFNAKAGGDKPRWESFTVRPGPDGELNLVLRTPDAASPARLGLSGDTRTLGVGLVNLSIHP